MIKTYLSHLKLTFVYPTGSVKPNYFVELGNNLKDKCATEDKQIPQDRQIIILEEEAYREYWLASGPESEPRTKCIDVLGSSGTSQPKVPIEPSDYKDLAQVTPYVKNFLLAKGLLTNEAERYPYY